MRSEWTFLARPRVGAYSEHELHTMIHDLIASEILPQPTMASHHVV